jgi:hypothetical protein
MMNRTNGLFAVAFALALTVTPAQAQQCVGVNTAAGFAVQAAHVALGTANQGATYLPLFGNKPTTEAVRDFNIIITKELIEYSGLVGAVASTLGTGLGDQMVVIRQGFGEIIVSSSKLVREVSAPVGGGAVNLSETLDAIEESTNAMNTLVSELPPFCG